MPGDAYSFSLCTGMHCKGCTGMHCKGCTGMHCKGSLTEQGTCVILNIPTVCLGNSVMR